MKSIIFDSGPIITLAINDLLDILKPLKQKFGGEFYITPAVKYEIVDRPLQGKKFKFEALQTLSLIEKGILRIYDNEKLKDKADEILELSNNIFYSKKQPIRLVHAGEVEAIAAYLLLDSSAIVVDERTTRMLIEEPNKLHYKMQNKLHTKLITNKENFSLLKEQIKDINLIRSTELGYVAYKMGLLQKFAPRMKNSERILLDALLWSFKLNGCSISSKEIKEIERIA